MQMGSQGGCAGDVVVGLCWWACKDDGSLRLQRRKQSDSRGFGDFVSAPVPLRVHVCAYVSLWASPCVYVCACVPV